MPFSYAVLGAGRQGTAAAYDMARWGEAERVKLADQDLDAARRGCRRVNDSLGRAVAEPVRLDVTNGTLVEAALSGVDACLSAVPYGFNPAITRAAIRAGSHLCDLGGHLGVALQPPTPLTDSPVAVLWRQSRAEPDRSMRWCSCRLQTLTSSRCKA